MSSSDEEEILLLFALLKKKKKKRYWVHPINKKRAQFGEYHRLCIELQSHEDKFFQYFRMSRLCFEELHDLLKANIAKCTTNWRKPIHTRERLAICLRYLATGDSHQTIAFSYRVGRSTVSKIVRNVCQEIWKTLQPKYLPSPNRKMWLQSVEDFLVLWGFPNCLGSIDGKHIKLKCPRRSGSAYFCYKNYFSIVLLAIVDPHYKFMVVDIGNYGRHSDSAIFEKFNHILKNAVWNIIEKQVLPEKNYHLDKSAVEHGHCGLRLPPYHCHFNAIEMVWSETKRYYDQAIMKTAGLLTEVLKVWIMYQSNTTGRIT
ncbi:protein ANTAGONIST OF LIKE HETEROCHROMATIN PROTEIN 1-like [Sitophilus oryzae]|uniref:Protein ANTAGONIST OF LIKE HETEROCHROMATIN PROTEIN 1-like n=1 Tax=Sitophilus oryzae TaxID=7048 RepID=A0A6J2YCP1_SITOR|nr:protein ANTAGONIST OF LIKE HETEROCHROMATIN PROTEIN 1-like [Sitophilus oryzae]